ncbi:glucose-6-phosphate isomerase [Sediminicurvatus halobius]|uniref:Glucose-6-phosphate isomerase n=1 Tax=Sediminicurvatus halobius TaxID=2182432 RepID=A0A2U2N0V4_9GAMM|nr:glucose-6-phosphate isomerase [Spiribacter halobius]PWG62816.1 glucose-6-phosphate isomerase [Spiribacter halobius]UEX77034.1 glucose-6-phosphate isomerase [Spiribacter halobius]
MQQLKDLPSWTALLRHRRALQDVSLRELFERDPGRFERFSANGPGCLLDFSKNRITHETLDLLLALAAERGLESRREALFTGEIVNASEGRPALHTALRGPASPPLRVAGEDVAATVHATVERMAALADAVRAGERTGATGKPVRDVINIGIGGSDLGPRLALEALAPLADGPRVHFVANVDGVELERALAGCDPETTLVLVVSKSFGTSETMRNAAQAMDWLRRGVASAEAVAQQVIPITANLERVRALGLDPELALPMWDWVGGRYSLWSAVGLSVMLGVGAERFRSLLDGAHAMDRHFREAPLARNLPVILGLLSVWNATACGLRSQAVVPYSERLARLPGHLQQLLMESNGKSVTVTGEAVTAETVPVIWGQTGTPSQHAFFQALHQGTDTVPVDFIGVAAPVAGECGDAEALTANLLAQSQALMRGRSADEIRAELTAAGAADDESLDAAVAARVCPGNRPSNTLLLQDLAPERLGALIALYEHRAFVEGTLWGINSFDQWGVELGKQLAEGLLPAVRGEAEPPANADASTRGLVAAYRRWRE